MVHYCCILISVYLGGLTNIIKALLLSFIIVVIVLSVYLAAVTHIIKILSSSSLLVVYIGEHTLYKYYHHRFLLAYIWQRPHILLKYNTTITISVYLPALAHIH